MVRREGNGQGTAGEGALPRRQWHPEVFAEWFGVKGTSKVRREREHCRDGSGTREVFAEWFGVKGTSKVRREREHCRDGSGTGDSGNRFLHFCCYP